VTARFLPLTSTLLKGHTMKSSHEMHRALKRSFLPGLLLVGFMLFFSVLPAKVFAGRILDAELRLTYESNVVGLLSDQPRGPGNSGKGTAMMQQLGMGGPPSGPKNNYTGSSQSGDLYATVSAEAGGYQDVSSDVSLFAKAFAEHSAYDTFTDLDATIGGVSAGISASLSDAVLARVAVLGKIKRFGDSERDSTAGEGNVSLKEKLTSELWLREFVAYEKNHADNAVFSYTGTTVGIGAGYALTRETLATIGYSYMVRKFEEPSGSEIKTNTFSAGAEYSFSKSWSVAGEYDLQLSKEDVTGSSTTDNILSAAVRYSY
jgi:opacity protein-like surface antigen